MASIDVSVHLRPSTAITLHAYADCEAGPFVSVHVMSSDGKVSLMALDPAALDQLAAVIVEARGELAAMLSKAVA